MQSSQVVPDASDDESTTCTSPAHFTTPINATSSTLKYKKNVFTKTSNSVAGNTNTATLKNNTNATTATITSSNNNGTTQGTPLGTSPKVITKREKSQPLGRRVARARWAITGFLPFIGLMLHRQEKILEITDGYMTVFNVLISALIMGVALVVVEIRDGTHVLMVVSSLLVGGCWGSLFPSIQDLKWIRLGCMAFFGVCCGQLKFHWEIKKLSRRRAHPLWRRAWVWCLQTCGVTLAFMLGEFLGCLLFVEDGFHLLSYSWYGYFLVLVLPFATFQVSSLISKLLVILFGNNAHWMDMSKLQWIYWGATLVMSVALFFLAVGYFLVNYVPYVWDQQLLLAPYAILLELVSFQSRKSKDISMQSTAYEKIREEYGQVIKEVLEREGRGCH